MTTTAHCNHQENSKIGIVGLGLIGGSLGLDLQEHGYEVLGYTNKSKTARRAEERKLATKVSTDPIILKECSLIFIALPLDQIINPNPDLLKHLPKQAVITDVGSVKKPITEHWTNLHPRFVGSHPMAGTNQAGVEAGHRGLFKNRPWIATPIQKTDVTALNLVKSIANKLNCKWIEIQPDIHDQAVALISHLPIFISATLLQTASLEIDDSLLKLTKAISSSGFFDTTRVGGGNSKLAKAMVIHNKNNIIDALKKYQSHLQKMEEIISSEQFDELEKELDITKNIRNSFLSINQTN